MLKVIQITKKRKKKKRRLSLPNETFKFLSTNQIKIGPLYRAGVGPHPLQWIEIWNEPTRQPTGGQ